MYFPKHILPLENSFLKHLQIGTGKATGKRSRIKFSIRLSKRYRVSHLKKFRFSVLKSWSSNLEHTGCNTQISCQCRFRNYHSSSSGYYKRVYRKQIEVNLMEHIMKLSKEFKNEIIYTGCFIKNKKVSRDFRNSNFFLTMKTSNKQLL